MRRLTLFFISLLCILSIPTWAQDALNLPTELYILLNDGQVERYGLGADGVQTVTPDDQFVVDFGVASDDNWLAYRTQDGLYIGNINDPSNAQVIDTEADVPPIRGNGDTLAWSPDDAMIAYVTLDGIRVYFRDGGVTDIAVNLVQHLTWSPSGEFLVAETQENIWWVYRRVGTEMLLTSVVPSSQGITWLSNSALVFAPIEGGLFAMDLNDNNAQTTIRDASQVYGLPYHMTEGVYRVFVKNPVDDTGSLALLQISEDGSVVSEDIGEGAVGISNSVRWSEGGQLLIGFQGGVMALIDPIGGQGFTLPITSAVAYDWGTIQSNVVDVIQTDGDVYFLGEDIMGVRQVWTFDENGTPFSITPATGEISDYVISPDSGQIAYVSQNQLWVYDRDDDEVVSLVEAREPIRQPEFSPDGRRIAYSVDTVDDSPTGGIWVVTIADEENDILLANGAAGNVASPPHYSQPQWAPNINALLLKAVGTESTTLSILDVNTLEVLPLGQYDDGFWLNDGRVIAWGDGSESPQASEIVILDPNTQQIPISLFTLPQDIQVEQLIQISANDLRLITRQNTFGPSALLSLRIPINGTFERLYGMSPIVDPIVSPDGTKVVGLTRPDGNLMLLDPEANTEQMLSFPVRVANIIWK